MATGELFVDACTRAYEYAFPHQSSLYPPGLLVIVRVQARGQARYKAAACTYAYSRIIHAHASRFARITAQNASQHLITYWKIVYHTPAQTRTTDLINAEIQHNIFVRHKS